MIINLKYITILVKVLCFNRYPLYSCNLKYLFRCLLMSTTDFSSSPFTRSENIIVKPLICSETKGSQSKITEGGLRLQGKGKGNSDEKPLITVVTVVYNGAESLEDTIISVIEQGYDNVEYIIVDGGSTDGTLNIIKQYEHVIDYWISEPDKGIYDAMNKGIDLGAGKWINFMNAGDYFFDADVLLKIFDSASDFNGFDVIYGDHEVKYPNKKRIVKAGDVRGLWKGSQFCHQSSFVRLAFHKNKKFNLNRKIAADFEFFYMSMRAGSGMIYLPIIFSKVSSGGVSDVKRLESIGERYACLDKNIIEKIFYAYLYFKEFLKIKIRKVFNIF